MKDKKLMLTVSAGEWDGISHRPHHFMRRSAKTGWTVIYLEPPASIIAPLKNKKMLSRWTNWRKGLRLVEENIYLLAPPPILPFTNKLRFINKLNQRIIAASIKKALKNFNPTSIDLYTFLPNAIDLLPLINFDRVIYDCVDDHASFTGLTNSDTIHQMEKELMKMATVSFATARQLIEDKKAWSNNFHLLPNGAEFERFSIASKRSDIVPADINGINQPMIGFVGGISDWIDISLITNVAKQMKDFTFVMIGPVATNIDTLRELSNVRILGAKEYQELPTYISHFSACLIPFKINKLTESVNPIKMYEYLSAGKPIVSTALPEVITYNNVITIIHNQQEMIEAINKAIRPEENTDERVKERQQIGKDNSWDSRWQFAVKQIEAGEAREKK